MAPPISNPGDAPVQSVSIVSNILLTDFVTKRFLLNRSVQFNKIFKTYIISAAYVHRLLSLVLPVLHEHEVGVDRYPVNRTVAV